MVPFFERATKDKDVGAGTLCCKLLERRSLLFGLDQPSQSRVDVYQIPPPDAVSSHEKIRRTIMEFVGREPPAQREAINMIGKLGAERALAILKGSGNDAPAPSNVPDDPESRSADGTDS